MEYLPVDLFLVYEAQLLSSGTHLHQLSLPDLPNTALIKIVVNNNYDAVLARRRQVRTMQVKSLQTGLF